MASSAAQVADEILDLLSAAASTEYFGEPVSQLEHALQCAQLARDAGATDEMIIAALLHDVGHLLDTEGVDRHSEIGVINHDEMGARYLLERGFSARVAELVESHVDSKRYLTATNPTYSARLSPASTATLALQAGPMNPAHAQAFAADKLLADKLRLRSCD